jgi:hypothetical protein
MPDGRIIAAGSFAQYNGVNSNHVVRINIDGTRDTSFNVGTGASSNILAMTLQPDGKVILGGNLTSYNGGIANRIVRLNLDGTRDLSFNTDTGFTDALFDSVLQSDGKVIVGGAFTTYKGVTATRIARLDRELAVGDSYGGGYFAGRFSIDSVQQGYKLIMAPKAYEQQLQIKTTFTSTGTDTTTINGLSRSNDMNTAEFPAASYCRGLNIGGFTDWYLPSRDELEILYRNFKPGTNTNGVGTHDSHAWGTNTNSMPPGIAYTAINPTQTQLSIFKAGESQALTSGRYWSSSRSVSQPAYCWNQTEDGSQFWGQWPTDSFYVRPVRRELE